MKMEIGVDGVLVDQQTKALCYKICLIILKE